MAGVTGDVEGSSMGRKGKGERGGPGESGKREPGQVSAMTCRELLVVQPVYEIKQVTGSFYVKSTLSFGIVLKV